MKANVLTQQAGSDIACFTHFGPTTHLDFARLKRLNYLSPLLPV